MNGDGTSGERSHVFAGLVAHDVEPSVGDALEHAREDLAAQPEGGVDVGVVCERADEEDRGRVGARSAERLRGDVDCEWDREEGGAPGSRPHIRQVSLGEDRDRVEAWSSRPLIAPPGADLRSPGETSQPARCLHHVLGPRGRWVVVDENGRNLPPLQTLNVLGHDLKVELHHLRPPFLDQALEGRGICRGSTIQSPRREADEHPCSPCEAPRDDAVRLSHDLLDHGATIGDGGVDGILTGGT